jgi:hypothetical protein
MKCTTQRGQQQRILNLLLQGFRSRRWISLPEILDLRISQYGRVIHQLRRSGWHIKNRAEFRDGKKYSWFWLESALPSGKPMRPSQPSAPAPAEQAELFKFPAQPATWIDPEESRGRER